MRPDSIQLRTVRSETSSAAATAVVLSVGASSSILVLRTCRFCPKQESMSRAFSVEVQNASSKAQRVFVRGGMFHEGVEGVMDRKDVHDAVDQMGDAEMRRRAAIAEWLTEKGETLDTLKALVEYIDDQGYAPAEDDSRLKFVERICEDLAALEESDPDEDTCEDVPLGGLSHEQAHALIEGVRAVISRLKSLKAAWPDDGRRAAAELERLLK